MHIYEEIKNSIVEFNLSDCKSLIPQQFGIRIRFEKARETPAELLFDGKLSVRGRGAMPTEC